jgi:hypothetical protein
MNGPFVGAFLKIIYSFATSINQTIKLRRELLGLDHNFSRKNKQGFSNIIQRAK